MSKKYVSVLKDSSATPGYRIIAPEDYVYTENGTKKVKKIDSKADKKVPAAAGNLATLDSTGNLADSGKKTTDFMAALPTAYSASGSATKTVTKVEQATTGEVSVTYSDIQTASTSQKGLVQLEDSTFSTSTSKAATPNAVKSAYDLANGKYSKPSGGIPSSDLDSSVQASLGKADSAIQGVKLNGTTLTPSSAKVVDLGNLKTTQTAVTDPTASGTTITAIATISQDTNGVITATKKTIRSASSEQSGVMSAADYAKLAGIATGAEVNQNAFSNVKVGDVTVAADSKTDTLTVVAGNNVTITPDATNDKITIAATDTTYTADDGIKLDGTVFKHTNSVSGGTVGPTTDTAGASFSIPYVTYDSQGHVTASGTRTHDVGTASTSGAGIVQLQDTIDSTATKAATPNAVKKAIEALDVGSVGGAGKYISAISETDGKISATATTMDSTPTASSTNAVTSGGVKTELDLKADKVTGATSGNLASLDATGNLLDSGKSVSDLTNVQADWNATSGDAFIKNKPYFTKYIDSSSIKFKVCTVSKYTSGGTGSDGIEVFYRRGAGAVHGHLLHKVTFELYLERIGDVSSNTNTVKFYYVENSSNLDIYAESGSYNRFTTAPLANMPKDRIDFTNFGTNVDSIPEGAVAINPVWVANSSASSGTAPVKVDAYGNLTAVPMDSTPTASSTNLMTSGDIKTALDDISTDVYSWYRTGNGNGSATTYKVCSISNFGTNNWTGFRFVFDYIMEYNSAYAESTGCVEIKVRTTGTSEPDYYIAVRPDGGKKSASLMPTFRLYKKWADNKLSMILCVTVGGAMYNGISMRIHGCMNQSGSDYAGLVSMATNTVYADETGYTEATLSGYLTYKTVYTNDSAVGSTSVPVYVNGDGAVTACTDDFVHDGDVTSTYSSTGTAPVNGTAVAAAISNKDDITSSFHSSSAVGYYKIANLTFDNINSVYAGAILKFVCRSFEALIAVSFSEYNTGNETGPIIGNIFVLNGRNNILGNDKYDIYVLRTASQTYDIYLHLKSTPGNASVSLLYATHCTYTRYTNSSKIDQLPTSIASLKLPYHKKIFGTNNNTTIGSTSVPVYVKSSGEIGACTDDFVHDGDVTSTYSSTGTAPVNGTAVASALSGIKQDGVSGATVNRFGTCSTAAGTAAKTVTITSGTFSLEAGAQVAVKFSNTNTANSPTLAVNSTAAKNIFVNGAQITSGSNKGILAGTVLFIYDGTQYHVVGNYDSNDTAFAKQFSLGAISTNTVTYTDFARMAIANTQGNGEAQIILASGVGIGATNMGTWHITVSNRGSTADTPKASMTVRCLNKSADTPEFGYHYDRTNAFIYFGVKSPGYRGNNTITVLSNSGATLKDFGDLTSAPTSWTAVTVTEYSDTTHIHGNIQSGGTLQATDVTIANGDKLVVTDASDSNKVARASAAFDGSTTSKALTQKGTFESVMLQADAMGVSGGAGIDITYSGSTATFTANITSIPTATINALV